MIGRTQNQIQKCVVCDRGVAHDGSRVFYELRITTLMLDDAAIRRQHGIELMLGGSVQAAAIAAVMGPDENLANECFPSKTVWVCMHCALRRLFGEVLESLSKTEES